MNAWQWPLIILLAGLSVFCLLMSWLEAWKVHRMKRQLRMPLPAPHRSVHRPKTQAVPK
jgi:hypothetical protein